MTTSKPEFVRGDPVMHQSPDGKDVHSGDFDCCQVCHPASVAEKYPLWTLTIRRSDGPYLTGTCGCGWVSLPFVRSTTVAEMWDQHMVDSISNPALHKETEQAPGNLAQNMALISPEVRTLREILFNHRALAAATALEITELMAELQNLIK